MRPARITSMTLWAMIGASVISSAWIRTAQAIPTTVTISAFVEDEDGRPLEGLFSYEISFYERELSLTSIDTITSEALVTAGVFSIPVDLPSELIVLDEAWYSLALDVDRDGLDLMDLFEDRFQITSVPFALSGAQAPYFFTHGGILTGVATSVGAGGASHLYLGPFVTPAGGVKFNRASVFLVNIGGGPLRCSFGIYDAEGRLVMTSGEIILPTGFRDIFVVEVAGALRPSSLYFTALGSNQGLQIHRVPLPAVPNLGVVRNVVVNGAIPDSFDPSTIDPSLAVATVIGIGLLK